MAKRVTVYFESDFVDGVVFDNEEEMKNFDSLINDKNYYLECCKKYIKSYFDYLCDNKEKIVDDLVLNNGKIIIEASTTKFSQYIIDNINDNCLCDTYFSELTEDIGGDDFNYMCECIGEFVIYKIIEFADDINKLVQIELNLC